MTDERRQAILDAVAAEEAAGRDWTYQSIFHVVGGRYAHLREVLKPLRAARLAEEGGVAVAEEPLSAADELAQTIAEMESEIEGLRTTYHQLHTKRQARELDVMGYARYQWLEDQLGGLVQDVEDLRQQWAGAHALEALAVGVEHHDACCPRVVAWVERGCHLFGDLQAWRAEGVTLLDDQQSKLVPLTTPRGRPAFELTGGDMQVQRFLAGLQGGGAWIQVLNAYMHEVMTVGAMREAADVIDGTRPFSETLKRNFIEGYSHASNR